MSTLFSTEDGRQKTEDRGRRAEDRGRRTEDGGQKTEDGGQKTEDRRRRAEDGGQKTPVKCPVEFRCANPSGIQQAGGESKQFEQTTAHHPD